MAAKYRTPGLQVPSGAQGEALAFFNALKERLELLSGERGDPEQRMVSIRELKDLGIVSVRTENQRARIVNPASSTPGDEDHDEDSSASGLDFTLYPPMSLASASGDLQLLVQGVRTSERYKIPLSDLFTLFARLDQESAPQYPWSWEGDDYGFDITGPAPRFRFVEQAEESDTESTLPVDSAIWDAFVESGVFEFRLRNDDDTAGSAAFAIGRTALNTDYFRVYADTLSVPLDNAEFQIGAGSDLRLFHDGTDSFIRNDTGNLDIFAPDGRVGRFRSSATGRTLDVGDGTGSAGVVIDGSDANVRELVYATAGVQRWNFRVTGDETGADAGSNFVLVRRDDAGVSLGNAFQLVRSSGQARFVDGTALLPALSYLSDPDTGVYRAGANHLGLAAGGALIAAAWLNGATRTLTIGDGTNATRLNFNRPAGVANEIAFQTAGIDRWYMRINNTAESGANAGSNFQWLARADDGSALFTILTVTRASGIVGFNQPTQFADGVVGAPGIAFSADADTGLYRPGANVLGLTVGGAEVVRIVTAGFTLTPAQGELKKIDDSGRFIICGGSANNTANGANIRIEGIDSGGIGAGGHIQLATSTNKSVQITSGTSTLQVPNGTNLLPSYTFGGDTDLGFFRQAANALGVSANAVEVARFDANTTAGQTRFMIYDVDNGTLERVSVGVADSGGAGFKVLRISN